jgi:P-type Ca2+ transporter type 2C
MLIEGRLRAPDPSGASEPAMAASALAAVAHALDARRVAAELGVPPEAGLSSPQAAERLTRAGPNVLLETPGKSRWRIAWEQLTAIMVLVLIAAGVISLLLGEVIDALAIATIVLLNATLGFQQDYRAERAIAALRRLTVPLVRVRRDGGPLAVPAPEVVPGDVLLLEPGDLVAADARLLASPNLRVGEASLTGESQPVEKAAELAVARDVPLAERRTMVYMGTAVAYGRGEAIVVATGMRTELGRIAAVMQAVEREPTPLQRRLEHLSRQLAVVALVLVGIVFVVGLARGEDARLTFLTAISLAVAAVPEGLPAIVTVTLAVGAQRMLRRRALVRKLLAVETLGSVSVICTDKTGTLTQNRMTVTHLEVGGERLELGARHEQADTRLAPGFELALALGALCNDAFVQPTPCDQARPEPVGDPTEAALVVAAARHACWKPTLDAAYPRVAEVPFDSGRKRMLTVHRVPAERHRLQGHLPSPDAPYMACAKGAPDTLLEVCTATWTPEGIEPLSNARRSAILEANAGLAREGLRVLGVAFRPLGEPDPAAADRELVFVGLVGMLDPPRPEVQRSVQTCAAAGVRPVMITGDHALTAAAVARHLGMGDGRVLSGRDLDRLDGQGLEEAVASTAVYARVAPEHKLRIVAALQRRGEIVAMTGDGVNDAPALKQANIGVAMGVEGTDVAREAADMVLLDDNFATIVAAVEEGRVIYENIRKFLKYLLATNAGELWVMLLGPVLGLPLPLLPLQILWLNLVTDGLPALALSVEPPERDVMTRAPRRASETLLGEGMLRHIGWVGLLIGGVALGLGAWGWQHGNPAWQSMVFTSLALLQLGHVLAIRVERASVLGRLFFTNRPLLGSALLLVALQLAVVYVPVLQDVFATVPLSATELLSCLAASSVVFWAVEAEKQLRVRNAQATGC